MISLRPLLRSLAILIAIMLLARSSTEGQDSSTQKTFDKAVSASASISRRRHFAEDILFGTRQHRRLKTEHEFYKGIREVMKNHTQEYAHGAYFHNQTYKGGPLEDGILHVEYDAELATRVVALDDNEDVVDSFCIIEDGVLWLHVTNESTTANAWKIGEL